MPRFLFRPALPWAALLFIGYACRLCAPSLRLLHAEESLPNCVSTTVPDLVPEPFSCRTAATVPGTRIYSRSSTAQKRAGRQMFSTSRARAKSGAICAGVKPAMPHPISVTRNLSCGLRRAKSMKAST